MIVTRLRLDTDQLGAGRQATCDGGNTSQQPTAADGNQERIESFDLVEQLEGHSALTGHHRVGVVRGDQHSTLELGDRGSDIGPILGVAVIADDPRTLCVGGGDLFAAGRRGA